MYSDSALKQTIPLWGKYSISNFLCILKSALKLDVKSKSKYKKQTLENNNSVDLRTKFNIKIKSEVKSRI